MTSKDAGTGRGWRARIARETARWRRRGLWGARRFRKEFERFRAASEASGRALPVRWSERLRCEADRGPRVGFDRHYVYHQAWAARVLAGTRPARHVDISSAVEFVGMLSAFLEVEAYDFRQLGLDLPGVRTGAADLTALPFESESIPSLSCMHVVEHLGLGRYGDALDPLADRRGMAELERVLAPGGDLLFVVPVGRPRVVFNAHRVYAHAQVRQAFAALDLVGFALVPDRPEPHDFLPVATPEQADAQAYGCGCFHFRSRRQPAVR